MPVVKAATRTEMLDEIARLRGQLSVAKTEYELLAHWIAADAAGQVKPLTTIRLNGWKFSADVARLAAQTGGMLRLTATAAGQAPVVFVYRADAFLRNADVAGKGDGDWPTMIRQVAARLDVAWKLSRRIERVSETRR